MTERLSASEKKELESFRTERRVMSGVIFSGIWFFGFHSILVWLLGYPPIESPRWDLMLFIPVMALGGIGGWKYPLIKKKLKGVK